MNTSNADVVRVLLVSGWVDQAFTFVRSFAHRPVRLSVADCWPNSPVGKSRYCDRFHLVPPLESETHVDEILEICVREAIDVVLPIQHDEVLALSQRKEDFVAQRIALPVPPASLMRHALDKYWVSQLADRNGIPGPRTVLLRDMVNDATVSTDLEFPLVGKLRRGTGQTGQRKLANRDDLLKFAEEMDRDHGGDEVILQEYIPGHDWDAMYTVGLLYDHRHRLKTCVPLKKIRSRPYTGGTAVCTQAVHQPAVAGLAIGLMESIGAWEGIADVEVKLDPRDGAPKLIELNPRAWGSMYGAYAAGVDLPWLWIQLATHTEIPSVDPARNGIPVSFMARDLCLLADLTEDLFTSRRREAWTVLKTYVAPYIRRGHSRHSLPGTSDFVLRDLRPFLANLRRVKRDLIPGIRQLARHKRRERQ